MLVHLYPLQIERLEEQLAIKSEECSAHSPDETQQQLERQLAAAEAMNIELQQQVNPLQPIHRVHLTPFCTPIDSLDESRGESCLLQDDIPAIQ